MTETRTQLAATAAPPGYRVWTEGGIYIGNVIKNAQPSHIRRGRPQVAPWWLPVRPDGTALTNSQTRTAAIDQLVTASKIEDPR
jgi:hypothetical protein